MDKTTRFADIAVGTKFILGGNDRTEYTKVSTNQARGGRRLANGFRPVDQPVVRIAADTPVVTETGATVSDILGSWGKL